MAQTQYSYSLRVIFHYSSEVKTKPFNLKASNGKLQLLETPWHVLTSLD
jgi:hypothetical protein